MKQPTQANIIDIDRLPKYYPTHHHETIFWEMLGRTVATFGFLENVLARAIFAFTATTTYSQDKLDEEFSRWIHKLEKALTDPLGSLINTYQKAVYDNRCTQPHNFSNLIEDLRKASEYRNVLCHGCWGAPDSAGGTVPFYVRSRDKQKFLNSIDAKYLQKIQTHTTELIVAVINTVTSLGYQFPGSSGPGTPIR